METAFLAKHFCGIIIKQRSFLIQLKNKNMEQQNQQSQQSAGNAPEQKKNTGMAALAYVLFFIPLLTESKNDPFVKFHVKQGIVLFVAYVVTLIVARIPVIGLFSWILSIGTLVLFIIGLMNALGGKETPLPIIGQFADKFQI